MRALWPNSQPGQPSLAPKHGRLACIGLSLLRTLAVADRNCIVPSHTHSRASIGCAFQARRSPQRKPLLKMVSTLQLHMCSTH